MFEYRLVMTGHHPIQDETVSPVKDLLLWIQELSKEGWRMCAAGSAGEVFFEREVDEST